MTPLVEGDRLILTASFVECAALWSLDAAVSLNAWDPCRLELYCARWFRLPGDVRLCGHLDFRDPAGRTWIEVVDWSAPRHPRCTHPGVLERWEETLARHLFTWESSLSHPRFRWLHTNNPTIFLTR